jgi:hypothetical protein
VDGAGGHEAADVIDEGVRGGGGGGEAAGGDDGGAAFADGLAERALQPGIVIDDLGGRLAVDRGVGEGREHGRAVVAVDEDVLHGGEIDAGLLRELGLGAVLVEAHHGGEALGGRRLACEAAIMQFVLAGLPTTATRASAAATASMIWPWPMKILPLSLSRSARSMPGPRGLAPTSRHQLASLKPTRVGGLDDALEKREGAVVEFHRDAFERLEGLLDRGLDQLEDDRLVGAEHRAGGDAEKERVTDLAGGAGDCDTDGGFHKEVRFSPRMTRIDANF